MKRPISIPVIAVGLAIFTGAAWAFADRMEDIFTLPLDHPAIRYTEETPTDAVASLNKRLESGQEKLAFAGDGPGYLPATLKLLGINPDSQVLVFSKTSIQANRISPAAPRALYFNDDVSVGFVLGGELLELSAVDPKLGVSLYTRDAFESDQVGFARRLDCLQCHQGPHTLAVPGLMISSLHPQVEVPSDDDPHGNAYITDHRTKFAERWGGWYVTGTHGEQANLGNNVNLVDPVHPGGKAGPSTQNLTTLAQMFNPRGYIAATSDIVALMTLEHQTRMTNLMIRLGWDARMALYDSKMDETKISQDVMEQIQSEIDEMVKYMLFADEAPLTAPVTGVSTFTKTFPQRGPRDAEGRSLRDFDLKTRLFRYPLSYMIYTAAFDGMPDMIKNRVYQRLYDVLTGKDQSKTFAGLSAEDRSAVLEIVRQTKSKLPSYWTAASTR